MEKIKFLKGGGVTMHLSGRQKQKIGKAAFAVFRLFFIIGMAYVLLFPLLVMITRAIRPYTDMYNPSIVWIPSALTLENFKYALTALGGVASVFKTSAWNVSINIFGILDMIPAIINSDTPLPIPFCVI